jgi:hypothetical protein
MSCPLCAGLRQYAHNGLLITDKLANTLLLGDPNETISRRFARGAVAGNRFCKLACRILGFFSKDHCTWSLTPGSTGRELWSWDGVHEQKTISFPTPME